MSKHDSSFIENEINEVNSGMSEFIIFLRDFIIILIAVFFIRIFLITPFQINGQSMEASYHDKEFILVDKFSYLDFSKDTNDSIEGTIGKYTIDMWQKIPIHVGDPVRGDVVVIKPHVDKTREHYIKRVIGLPGDIIRFESGSVLLKKNGADNFVKLQEKYLTLANSGHTYLPEYIEGNQFLVPEDTYWVMGDNRQNSADSRQCFQNCFQADINAHFIKRSNVIGRVLLNFGYFNIFSNGGLLKDGRITWTHRPRFLSHPRNATYPELDN
ncbi:signal peptidase I [Candidatus Gracilibacteria bacterium]|nr:signal peptidase I [Candidatus Gracilibacteria bacterium]